MQLRNYIVADLRRTDTAAILEMYKMNVASWYQNHRPVLNSS